MRNLLSVSRRSHAQSTVEFALVAPLLVIMMLAIVDMARIYTTMLTVESAAREAADFGTFGAQKWNSAVYAINTEPELIKRACVASSTLPDYEGSTDTCSNPTVTYQLSGDKGATWGDVSVSPPCDDALREPPCWLRVTLRYDFHLLVPINIELLGAHYGVPNTITFQRTSTFPMTDLGAPTP